MPYAVGVDVGTTFTAAAVWRDERVEIVALETHHVTVPSVVFAAGDDVFFGTAAATRGAAQPGGLAREFKRRLGDSLPLVLSGAPYSADRLVALFVRWVVDSITEQFGEAPSSVVVTHPANWTEFQLHLLMNALEQVGLGDAGLLSEPQAAAHDFGAAAHLDRGELVLVYDLGGGTFDVALLRKDNGKFSHVGESAGVERLGGIDFDEAVFQHVVAHIPPDAITRARDDPSGRMAFAQLRRACVEAKESLSSEVAVDIPVLLPGHTSTVRLTRAEFENMIRPMLGQTIDLSQRVLQTAGITPNALSAILLVGGSSRIPLVSELVRQQTGATVRVDAHPKLVVARGAGRWSGELPVTAAGGGDGNHRTRLLAAGAGAILLVGGVLAFAFTRGDDETDATDSVPTVATTIDSAETTPPTTPATVAPASTTSTTSPPIDQVGQVTWGTWGGGGGRLLALGRVDGTVRVVEVSTGEELFERRGHNRAVRHITFLGGGRLATASDDGTVRVWNEDGTSTLLRGHVGPVNYVRSTSDPVRLATGGEDGTVRVWDPDTGEVLTIQGDGTSVSRVEWSLDGSMIAASSGNTATIWDARTGDERATLRGHTDDVTFIQWGAGDNSLVTASEDGTPRVWDTTTGETILELRGHEAGVAKIHWVTDEREQIITGSLDGTARVWDVATGELIRTFGEVGDPGVGSLGTEHQALRLATGNDDGVVQLWDESSGEHVASLTGHTAPVIWTSALEGRVLALAADGTVRVYNAESLDEMYFFTE